MLQNGHLAFLVSHMRMQSSWNKCLQANLRLVYFTSNSMQMAQVSSSGTPSIPVSASNLLIWGLAMYLTSCSCVSPSYIIKALIISTFPPPCNLICLSISIWKSLIKNVNTASKINRVPTQSMNAFFTSFDYSDKRLSIFAFCSLNWSGVESIGHSISTEA